MTKNPAPAVRAPDQPAGEETKQQKFERILSREPFKPLKAILDNLRFEGVSLCDAVGAANSYPDLLSTLGYRIVLAVQIHVQDCYSRLGEAGGIRAVLPYHDVASYSTLVTLVNFNATLTTTPKSVAFFSAKLADLRIQLTK